MKKEVVVATSLAVLTMGSSFSDVKGAKQKPETIITSATPADYFMKDGQAGPGQKNQNIVENPTYSEFKEYIKTHKYVFVEFGAPNCSPCKVLQKMFREYSIDPRAGNLSFVFVDVSDKNNGQRLFGEYAILDKNGYGDIPQTFLAINGKAERKDVDVLKNSHMPSGEIGYLPDAIGNISEPEKPAALRNWILKKNFIDVGLEGAKKLIDASKNPQSFNYIAGKWRREDNAYDKSVFTESRYNIFTGGKLSDAEIEKIQHLKSGEKLYLAKNGYIMLDGNKLEDGVAAYKQEMGHATIAINGKNFEVHDNGKITILESSADLFFGWINHEKEKREK